MGELCYTTVKNKITAGEFDHKLSYPTEEVLKQHKKHRNLTKEIDQLHARILKLRSDAGILVSDMQRAYNTESSDLHTKFKQALETIYGLQNHPKRDKIWMKACEGHSSGLIEVLSEYDGIAELVS